MKTNAFWTVVNGADQVILTVSTDLYLQGLDNLDRLTVSAHQSGICIGGGDYRHSIQVDAAVGEAAALPRLAREARVALLTFLEANPEPPTAPKSGV